MRCTCAGTTRMSSHAVKLLLNRATEEGTTPGGVLMVADVTREVAIYPFGRTQTVPELGAEVTAETVYDVASLTKPVATIATLLRLCAEGVIAPDARVSRFLSLPKPAAEITVSDLAGHGSGLPAHLKFYERILAGDLAGQSNPRDAIVYMAANTPLERPRGQSTVYSDLGYLLLGALIEKVTEERLDQAAQRLVFGPLGMTSTRFIDLLSDEPYRFAPGTVAATEVCPYRGLVRGEVHDDNCHSAGGICGHAGLFSTVADISRFAAAIVTALHGADGLFQPDLVRFFTSQRAAPNTTWRLGFDTPNPRMGESHAGDLWPRDGIGHLGFTGTSLWIDPGAGRWVVLLTNRVHPTRDNPRIGPLRRAVMDATVRALAEGTLNRV